MMPTLLVLHFVSHGRMLSSRQSLPALVPTFAIQDDMTSNKAGNKSRLQKGVSSGREKNSTTTDFTSAKVKSTLERDRLMAAAGAVTSKVASRSSWHASQKYFHSPASRTVHDFYHFLLKPTEVCFGSGESSKGSPFLLVLVLSSYLPLAAQKRQAIRATYGSVTTGQQWPGGKPLVAPVRMLFLLGSPPESKHKRLIEMETTRFGDILAADFIDTYKNLTLKVLHGLYWVLHNCPQVKFVLKADDDVFVNLPLLTAFLSVRGENNSLYGKVYGISKVIRTGRWRVSKNVYPISTYPEYLSGAAYVMSIDAAKKIVEASKRLSLIPIEDAFITGILTLITKARLMQTSGFTHFNEGKPSICDFIRDTRFVGNRMNSSDKQKMWETLNDNRRSCS